MLGIGFLGWIFNSGFVVLWNMRIIIFRNVIMSIVLNFENFIFILIFGIINVKKKNKR